MFASVAVVRSRSVMVIVKILFSKGDFIFVINLL